MNGPRATVITFNIVTSKDFQPMITAMPIYRILYEPYKVVLYSISREKGSKYAGYINGDLVIRLSPLNQLLGSESDEIIIESKLYQIFIPPNSSSAANSSQNRDSYRSCTLEQTYANTLSNKSLPNNIIQSRSLYDQSGRRLTILLTNSTETINSLANLVVSCKNSRIKNHNCPANVEFDVKTTKDYRAATSLNGNNRYVIETDSECTKLRCGLLN